MSSWIAVVMPWSLTGTLTSIERDTDGFDAGRRTDSWAMIRCFDHVGITLADIDKAIAFFVSLGFELEGRMLMEGDFVDTVIGIPNSRSVIATLRLPDAETMLELSSFSEPAHSPGSPNDMANDLGLRNLTFEVDDVEAIVDQLAGAGYALAGGIGQYEDIWRSATASGGQLIASGDAIFNGTLDVPRRGIDSVPAIRASFRSGRWPARAAR